MNWWTPLLFWFNKDIEQSLPAVAIPNCSKIMKIETCNYDKLMFAEHPG